MKMQPAPFESKHYRIRHCKHGTFLYNKKDILIGQSMDLYGEWCEGQLQLLAQLIVPDKWIIDIGANIGVHSIFFAKQVGPEGEVLAFEAQPVIYRMLCANTILNEAYHVTPYPFALGAKKDTIKSDHVDWSEIQDLSSLPIDTEEGEIDIPVTTLDNFDIPSCHLIRIAVGGMELDVLEGAEDTIKTFQPFLYIACNDKAKAKTLIQQLHEYEYRSFWHSCALYNETNFYGQEIDIFDKEADSTYLLCIPKSLSINIDLMEATLSNDASYPLLT